MLTAAAGTESSMVVKRNSTAGGPGGFVNHPPARHGISTCLDWALVLRVAQMLLPWIDLTKPSSAFLGAAWNPSPWHCKNAKEGQLICCQGCSWCQARILASAFLSFFNLLSSGFQTKLLQGTFHVPCLKCLVLKCSVTKIE